MSKPPLRCARQRTAGFAHSLEGRRLPGRQPIAGTYTDVRTRKRLDQDGAQNITANGVYAPFGQLTALNRSF
ncbi:hypothetical protein BHE74_00000182 [Ensete ventricosum]|nr:hypothetical protein BHE74_00000182 [Ensete ventricosum]